MLCLVCLYSYRLARTGFEELDADLLSSDANDCWFSGTQHQAPSVADDRRIPLSSGLLMELLSGIYYAMLVTFCLAFCSC